MRRTWLLMLLLLPVLIWAQGAQQTIPGDPATDEDYEDIDEVDYGMSGVVGATNINGETYSQVRLRPELNFGKMGFGLDLDFLINSEGHLRKEDWNDWKDYLNKIFFIRWANRRDPFYFKAGCIPSYTLGHGLIFDHYSNMLRYPEDKNVGGFMGINTPVLGAGFEIFTHNVHKNEVISARLHANPFYYSQIPALGNFKLGVNVGRDRNQFGKYPDQDGDGVPDAYDRFPHNPNQYLDTDGDGIADNVDIDINGTGLIDHPSINDYVAQTYPNITEDADPDDFNWSISPDQAQKYFSWKGISIYSVDYLLPLVETPLFYLDHYGEYATIDTYGNGIIFPGFSSKFLIFDTKLEFRSFSDQFLPGYFNRLYDEQRSNVSIAQVGDNRVYSLATKEEFLRTSRTALGWFGYLRAEVLDLGYVKMAFQDMYGKKMNTGKSLWINVTANPQNVLNLKEAGITYSQAHVPYIDFRHLRTSCASVSGILVYNLSESADLVGRYSEIYIDSNCDGKIKGDTEVISSFALTVEFTF